MTQSQEYIISSVSSVHCGTKGLHRFSPAPLVCCNHSCFVPWIPTRLFPLCTSPHGFWSSSYPSPFRCPSHRRVVMVVSILSKHVTNYFCHLISALSGFMPGWNKYDSMGTTSSQNPHDNARPVLINQLRQIWYNPHPNSKLKSLKVAQMPNEIIENRHINQNPKII